MAFLYQCEHFKATFAQEDASVRQYVERKLENLQHQKQIYAGKTIKVYDRSGILILRLMGQGMNSRIIMQEHKYEKEGQAHLIYLLREYIPQGRYEPRWRNSVLPEIESGAYRDKYPVPAAEIRAAESEFEAFLNRNQKELLPPPEGITNWFVEEPFGVNPEFSIYESQNWMAFSSDQMQHYSGDFFNLLKAIYKGNEDNGAEIRSIDEAPERYLQLATYEDTVYLIYEEYQEANNKILLLHNGGIIEQELSNEQDQKIQAAINYEPLKEIQNGEYSLEDISKGAVRAYPAGILLGKRDEWINIQIHSNKSNLALSPEQLDLLKNYNFPKFINGQAGSGKSEMLYYLFAEILFRKKMFEFQGNIIFLTENEELLRKGLIDTRNKLRNNSTYQGMDLELEEIENCFYPFRRFLRENLIEEEEVYPEDKYINFAAFKRLYEESQIPRHLKKKFPAEISWYVIYSYIKGQDAAKVALTPDDFKALPRKDRKSIDVEVYEGVYNEVWIPFYSKLREKGYWDQLDLVRDILDRYESIPPANKYTVILCDEAQDFTRVELQLLIRLSRFADYDLSNTNQVPITFAGDPFQTVNPTGFSLERLKRLFNKELEQELQFSFSGDPIADLAYNYRSSKKIVDLANAIQYLRREFLDTTDLRRPQEAKRIGQASLPSMFSLAEENHLLKEKLTTGVVFLVGCNDGEEEGYINADDWLEEQLIVKSAARAKGSEYPVVALYKFGQQFVEEFGKDQLKGLLANSKHYSSLPSGEQFKISFFFNKLYVAITRAQEECYIVDTSEGISNFWQVIMGLSQISIEEGDWKEAIKPQFLQFGNLHTLNEADDNNILKIAQEDYENGLAFEDPEKMRDAAKAYQQLGKGYENKVDFCIAKAKQFNHEYEEAGRMLQELTKKADASTCFWIGKHWGLLKALHSGDTERKSKVRVFIATVMQKAVPDVNDFLECGGTLLNAFEEQDCKGKISWRNEFVDSFVQAVTSWQEAIDPALALKVAEKLDSIALQHPAFQRTLAGFYRKGGNFRKAVSCWESLDDYDHKDYYELKLLTTSDPGEKIIYFSKLEQKDNIIKVYQGTPDHDYDKTEQEIVLTVLLEKNDIKAALDLSFSDKELWPKLYNQLFEKKQDIRKTVLLFEELIELIDKTPRNRTDLLTVDFFVKGALFITQKTSITNKKQSKAFSNNDVKADAIEAFVRLMARSLITPELLKDNLRPFDIVNSYLKGVKQKTIKIYDIEAVIALERTHSKLVEALEFFDKYPGFLLKNKRLSSAELNFLTLRWMKIQFKRALFDLNMSSAKMEEVKEDVRSRIKELLTSNLQGLSNRTKIDTLPGIDLLEMERMPAFPDYYQTQSQLADARGTTESMPAPTKQDLVKEQKQEEENIPERHPEPTAVPPEHEKKMNIQAEPDPGEAVSILEKLIPKQEVPMPNGANGHKTKGKETSESDLAPDVITASENEDQKSQDRANEKIDQQVGLTSPSKIAELEKMILEIRADQQRIGAWVQQLIETQSQPPAENSHSVDNLQEENNELWRELGRLQQKYIALLEKE